MTSFVGVAMAGFFLIGCTYRPQEKRLAKFQQSDGQIVDSYYRQSGDTIEFVRIISSGAVYTVQFGEISLSDRAMFHQRFRSTTSIPESANALDSLKYNITSERFAKRLFDGKDLLFIQIIPDSSMSNFDVFGFLNLRQEIEGKIDERLRRNNLGEWVAGDIGAGANMLFDVEDWQEAMLVAMEILKDEELLDHVIIAKRIMTHADDWRYEVVYPIAYEGAFSDM